MQRLIYLGLGMVYEDKVQGLSQEQGCGHMERGKARRAAPQHLHSG